MIEGPSLPNGLKVARVLGGLVQHLRLLQTVDPAINRKRTLDGRAVKSKARLEVESIEPLGIELQLYDITTGTGDFIANGVVSHNCFARPTHKYLDFNPGRDFEREIVVKVNVPEVLRTELARPSWKGEHVALGTNTDPYQWVEGRYKLMRGIWEAFRDFANPCSVLTKSPLLLRDLDLLLEIAEVAPVSANLSVPTLDEKAWRATEPHTPNPRARLEAVAELNRAGIPTGVLIAPLMPGINDAPEQVERILELATEAGATSVGGIALHLRGEVRGIFFDWLRTHRPDLVPRYERLYAGEPMRHLPSGSASRTSPPCRDDRRRHAATCAIATWSAPRGSGQSARPRLRLSPRSRHCSDVAAVTAGTSGSSMFRGAVRRKRPNTGRRAGADSARPLNRVRWLRSKETPLLRPSPLARQLRIQAVRRARRARFEALVITPLLVGVLWAYSHRKQLFGLDFPVRIVSVIALVILGWAFARSLGRALGPALLRRLEPGTAGTVGFLIRLITLSFAALVALRIAGLNPRTLAVGGAFTAVIFGLAAQQTLGNLIAGTVLLSARPFRVGDRVRFQAGALAGRIEGVVMSLGLLYTTLA